MEVTRKNFNETLPLVEKSIEDADFLVIDCEFTGLLNGRDVSIFDSPQEYYMRLLHGASDFMLIQFGLSAFCWDEKANHYQNETYNFYIYPRGRPGPERMFLCQSSSLNFLASQGFDFNKLINEGISYMTQSTETRLRENLAERQKTYANDKDNVRIPDENKQAIEDICNKVRKFLDESKTDEMDIDRCNAFMRRLLFQELGSRFKNEAFVETKVLENQNRVLKVTRKTSEDQGKDRDKEKKDKEWQELDEAVGFSKVARMISQSEKLVVGHNMLLDLLHTLSHFFQQLPSDYGDFKEFAHCMFPRILDTKYMSSLPPFKDKVNSTVLQHLLATLSEAPFSLPKTVADAGRGYSLSAPREHEAGYDAYVTGLCFLAMHSHVARMRGEPAASAPRVPRADCALLRPFLNKLYLARTAHQDSPYLHLAGDDPSPQRDHVFHLTFPKEWLRNDINQLFSPFGPITVQFVDDTSALVALARREQARDVARMLARAPRVTLLPYAAYKRQLDKAQDKQWKRPDIIDSACVRSPSDLGKRLQHGNATSPRDASCPVKVERKRSNSLSNLSPSCSPSPTSRKRTSSGVCDVDDAEPPAKKAELDRTDTDAISKLADASRTSAEGVRTYSQVTRSSAEKSSRGRLNGDRRRKLTAGAEERKTDSPARVKVIERFDDSERPKCVTAFKESDSWD